MTLAHMGRLANAFGARERSALAGLLAVIAGIHLLGWGLLLGEAGAYPALLGLGGLAYSFGLRHAFDADHISAIDNTTRKLLQEGRRPLAVGFFFSLGHSTVVLLVALGLGVASRALVESVVADGGRLRTVGALLGTGVSGAFLLLIGVLNLAILADVVGVYRRMRRGEHDSQALADCLVAGGLMMRLFARAFRLIGRSWQMYLVGFLFGLGFDTASEVALLAISAGAASQGMPLTVVVALPVIFAAGMALMDTLDGAFMARAYGWAFSSPVRKVFYNLTVTSLSVVVALGVGGVEIGQLAVQVLGLRGGVFDALAGVDFARLGFGMVGAFGFAWAAAFAFFKLRRVEDRWASGLAAVEVTSGSQERDVPL